jgi:hypothetical protein
MALSTDPETLVSTAVMLGVALVIGYLGYRIRYRGDVRLVAGYDPDRVTDPDAIAGLVGGMVLALAGVSAVYGVGQVLFPSNLWFWGSYLAVIFLVVLVIQVRGRRYVE